MICLPKASDGVDVTITVLVKGLEMVSTDTVDVGLGITEEEWFTLDNWMKIEHGGGGGGGGGHVAKVFVQD